MVSNSALFPLDLSAIKEERESLSESPSRKEGIGLIENRGNCSVSNSFTTSTNSCAADDDSQQTVCGDDLSDSNDARTRKEKKIEFIGDPTSDSLINPFESGRACCEKGWIEEKITLDLLKDLKRAFHKADVDRSGMLDFDEFSTLLRSKLGLTGVKEKQIEALFQKIDWSSEGLISWDEFCTYMQLEYADKEGSYMKSKQVTFRLPSITRSSPHREQVNDIKDTSDGTFIVCSQDGILSFWDSKLSLKRSRSVVPEKSPTFVRKRAGFVSGDVAGMQEPSSNKQRQKWITDFRVMNHFNKLMVTTGDREIQFFELSNFDPYCQIANLEHTPLKLDYSMTDVDECMIFLGDTEGCITIFVLRSPGECLREWKKAPKADGIATTNLDKVVANDKVSFVRWKVHNDWILELKYCEDIGQIITCSNDEAHALVIGCTVGSTDVHAEMKNTLRLDSRVGTEASLSDVPPAKSANLLSSRSNTAAKLPPSTTPSIPVPSTVSRPRVIPYGLAKSRLPSDQTVFKIYKGVRTFAFSNKKNILVTGGMDRVIRIWNPYVPTRPTAILQDHNAPIFKLFIAEVEDRIFSVATDKCIKIWDIQDQNCLLTVRPKSHKIRGELQACHYSSVNKAIMFATDIVAMLQLSITINAEKDIIVSHEDPVLCCVHNEEFNHVITSSEGSSIKVWDFDSGKEIFEFSGASDADSPSAITCLSLDISGRRLISGGRDGTVRIWNYNNGHCLQTLACADPDEISDLVYLELNQNLYIIAVGWDRKINIFVDSHQDSVNRVEPPIDYWHDDIHNGHKEDILAVSLCKPNLLATSSYDGETIVWNIISGHQFCHLNPSEPSGYTHTSLDKDLSVNSVTFLSTRVQSKLSANLVCSGPWGYLHFWNIFDGGKLLAAHPGMQQSGDMLTSVTVDKSDQRLYSANSSGFISVWDVSDYCLDSDIYNDQPPTLLLSWRAHIESITRLVLVESREVVISASFDCTCRLWTLKGEFIGTFGQSKPWNVGEISSYVHPMIPFDVLVDPDSVPKHPVIDDKQTTHSIVHADSRKSSDDSKMQEAIQKSLIAQNWRQNEYKTDEQIAADLASKEYNQGRGKRLRYRKLKLRPVDRGGPSEFQMLMYHPLEQPPSISIKEPRKSLAYQAAMNSV